MKKGIGCSRAWIFVAGTTFELRSETEELLGYLRGKVEYMVEDVIRENNEKINSYKRELEALRDFKKSIGSAKDGFNSVNRNKKSILSNLDTVKIESKIAALYQEGMRDSLTGIGEGVVSFAFLGLSFSVQMMINDYVSKIKALEAENLALSAVDL